MENAVSLHAIISGHVQGVFYRRSVALEAQRLNCTGYAENLPSGSVEVVAEGQKVSVERLLLYLWQGPASARVVDIKVTWGDCSGCYRDFSVR